MLILTMSAGWPRSKPPRVHGFFAGPLEAQAMAEGHAFASAQAPQCHYQAAFSI